MNWQETEDAHGRGFVTYLKNLLSLFPRNSHWLKVRDIAPKVDPHYDLIYALDYLITEGEISVDESNCLITRYRLGGTKIEPVGSLKPNMTISRYRTPRLPDMV